MVNRSAGMRGYPFRDGQDSVERQMAAKDREERRICDGWSQQEHLLLQGSDRRMNVASVTLVTALSSYPISLPTSLRYRDGIPSNTVTQP